MGDHLVKTDILLTVFNGAPWLPAQLDSLRRQLDGDFRVLYQDDGSTDGSPALLEATRQEDSRFIPGAEQGRHLGAAGNFLSLIRQSQADRVFLCDQDDIWEPDKVAALRRVIDETEQQLGAQVPLLAHSDCCLMDEAGQVLSPSFFRHQGWNPAALTLAPLLVQNNVTGCTLVMNAALRRLIAGHGVADRIFMHDWFIALTAAAFGQVVFLDLPLTRYRQHGHNTIGASEQDQVTRGVQALSRQEKGKARIRLTYTHTEAFRQLYGNTLPMEAKKLISAYLATQQMPKLLRLLRVHQLGCVMQSPITRLGQLFFG